MNKVKELIKLALHEALLEAKSERKIGKFIGGERYIHRDYEDHIEDQEGLKKAKALLSPEHREKYTIVKHNKKEGSFSFIHSPDFDKSDEPIAGDSHKVSADGKITITKEKKDPQIYHHKWQFVGDNYGKFNVDQSKQRSKDWQKVADKIKQERDPKVYARIGTQSFWQREVVPHIKSD